MASPEPAALLPKLNEKENLDTISPTAVLTDISARHGQPGCWRQTSALYWTLSPIWPPLFPGC